MSRKSKDNSIYNNLKGWEKQYLKRAEKYGHVGDNKPINNKQYTKYSKEK